MVPDVLRSGWFWASVLAGWAISEAFAERDPIWGVARLVLFVVTLVVLFTVGRWLWLGFQASRRHRPAPAPERP